MVFISYKPTTMGIWWYFLVGGLEHGFYLMGKIGKSHQIISGWWFGTWLLFSIYWEFQHPNWRTPSFFRGVGIPLASYGLILFFKAICNPYLGIFHRIFWIFPWSWSKRKSRERRAWHCQAQKGKPWENGDFTEKTGDFTKKMGKPRNIGIFHRIYSWFIKMWANSGRMLFLGHVHERMCDWNHYVGSAIWWCLVSYQWLWGKRMDDSLCQKDMCTFTCHQIAMYGCMMVYVNAHVWKTWFYMVIIYIYNLALLDIIGTYWSYIPHVQSSSFGNSQFRTKWLIIYAEFYWLLIIFP